MINYWIKDETRQEIITKTQIPNKGNFEFFATYFNLMDAKGLSFHLNEKTNIQTDKLVRKNSFEYLVLQHENFNEFVVLPNKNIEILTEKIVSKINSCNKESDVIDLVISQMN